MDLLKKISNNILNNNNTVLKKNAEHYIHIIQLIRSHNLGCVNFLKAVKQFGSVKRVICAIEENPKVLGRIVTLCTYETALLEYETGIKSGAECIAFDDADFPNLLHHIYDCPPFLWLKGNRTILSKNLCAVVGARNASVGGRKMAYSLAKNLGLNDFITVSGLATGIDTAAHQGSVGTGTIAVLASGVNVIYPDENQSLVHEILDNNGAIISEAPPNSPPQATMFIKRNRIISGLSLGTVVIEAAEKSGSLSTADFALEQNKEIFAVPGSPLDIRAAGTNRLLRNGANWVENSDDVISILQGIVQKDAVDKIVHKKNSKNTDTPKQVYLHTIPSDVPVMPIIAPQKLDKPSLRQNTSQTQNMPKKTPEIDILNLLSTTPIACDDLIRLTGLTSNQLLSTLSIMELQGDIMRHHGNMITKTIKKLA
jgi:DNA processing protein